MPQFLARLLCISFLSLVLWLPHPADAQSVLSLGSGGDDTSTENTAISDALKQLRENGAGIIVVDAEGNVVVTGGPPDPNTAAEEDPMAGASSMMKAQSEVQAFNKRLNERLEALPYSIYEVQWILTDTSPNDKISVYLWTLGYVVFFLLVGRVFIRRVYGPHLAARFVIPRIMEAPQGYREKMPFLFYRFFAGVLGTLIAVVIAVILSLIFVPHLDDLSIQLTITSILAAFAMSRVAADLWRMMLSPFLSQYRIPVFSDRDSKRLYIWAAVLASYNITAIIFSAWISDFGLNYNVYALLYGSLTLVGIFGNILMILVNGVAISNAIRGGRPKAEVSWFLRVLSLAWAPLIIGYFVFSWLELSFDLVLEAPTSIPPIAGVYATFMSIIVVYGIINYLIESYFARTHDVRRLNEELAPAEAEEGLDDNDFHAEMAERTYSIMTYEELARRVSGILAFVAGTYALIRIWDGDGVLLSNDMFDRTLDVVAILFIGYIIYHFFRIWIDSKIAEEINDAPAAELGDEGGGASSASRLATLLPLFRGAILAIVVVS
ncbi:MAG: mechanosensitive ion channel family protein, partial [Pseudomonadota bacterium]